MFVLLLSDMINCRRGCCLLGMKPKRKLLKKKLKIQSSEISRIKPNNELVPAACGILPSVLLLLATTHATDSSLKPISAVSI